MNWKKFDFIYAGGSSLSAGGGLEWEKIREEYKRVYGLEWGDEKDVTYPKYIADHFGVKLIHDAQSGSGAPRLVRRAYEYIEKFGLDVAKKTLFILEFTDPIHRIDMWCEKIQDHVIVNVRYDKDGKIETLNIQERISPTDRKYEYTEFEDIKDEVLNYITKYHNPIVYTNKFRGEIIGLFSFFEKVGIDYFYMFDNNMLMPYFDLECELNKTRRLLVEPDVFSVNHYCAKHNLTIKDELNGFTEDLHPGYYGNRQFSEKAITVIENNLKPILYVIGDSFTATIESHYKGGSEWFLKYFNYKEEIPKTFSEILSEYYDIEFVNLGFNGVSNQTIYSTFLKECHRFKKNDIVIIGWTSIMRFKLANQLNNLVDVIAFAHHPSPNEDISVNTIEEVAKNRGSYNVYWTEVENYIKSINKMFPDNRIYNWTWVSPELFLPEKLWNDEMINNKDTINFIGWKDANPKLKETLNNEANYVFDLLKNIDYSDVRYFVEKGRKVAFINHDLLKPKDKEKHDEQIKSLWYVDINYQDRCYKSMFPFKNYQTIYDETNGLVNDKHYGEKGHRDFAQDLIDAINKTTESFNEHQQKQVTMFDSIENRGKINIDNPPPQIVKKIFSGLF